MNKAERAGFMPDALATAIAVGAVAVGFIASAMSNRQGDIPSCYTPTPAEMTKTEALFAAPPAVSQGLTPIESGVPSPPALTAAEEARKLGLTLPDNRLEQRILYEDSFSSFDSTFRTARAYLAQFGVKLIISQAGNFDGHTGKLPTDKQLASPAAKEQLENIVAGFEHLPIQYVHLTGLKKILLAANTGYGAFAVTYGADDKVAVDVTSGGDDSSMMDHEMYHLLDASECGGDAGLTNDPAYNALNPGPIYHNPQWWSRENRVWTTEDGILGNMQYFSRINGLDPKQACKTQTQIKRRLPHVVTFSEYSLKNILEDKAEIGKNIAFPGDYSEVLNPKTPIIKSKFELLMARLYHFSPRLVRYFAATSARPVKNQFYQRDNCHIHVPNDYSPAQIQAIVQGNG